MATWVPAVNIGPDGVTDSPAELGIIDWSGDRVMIMTGREDEPAFEMSLADFIKLAAAVITDPLALLDKPS